MVAMDSSPDGVSLMAVCAVSGSIALLAFQAHKRLLSDFMKRMEHELRGSERPESRRSSRGRSTSNYANVPLPYDVEYQIAKKTERQRRTAQAMPLNRQVLYRGILQYRNFRGHHISSDSL